MDQAGLNKKEVFGVTGFIGSGKSMVSRLLALRLGCPHFDVDKIARDLMVPGKDGWRAVKGYNPKYIMSDGTLDRVLLRHDIFFEPAVKDAIDILVHPLVRARLVEVLAATPDPRAVVEVPLLLEAGWVDLFDRIILVYADKDVCLRRVILRDGVDGGQAERSYQSQMGPDMKIDRADHVIDNSGSWWNTQLQLLHLVDILSG